MYSRMAANPGFYPDPVPETRRYVVKPDAGARARGGCATPKTA
jgi:hypothetical protein